MAKRSKNGRRVYKKILLPYKKNNRIFNNPKKRPKPIILRVNGATIVIITQWDALCFSKKDCKKLFQHQDQLCQWITIIEQVRERRLATVNIWKTDQERVINIAFGASITAQGSNDRK